MLSEKLPTLRSGQQDAFDFFTAISLFEESEAIPITTPFLLQMCSFTTCINDREHVSDNNYSQEYYLEVDVPKTVDGLKSEIEEGNVKIISDWRCHICGNHGGLNSKFLIESLLPNYVFIKLQRAKWNIDGTAEKIMTKPGLHFQSISNQKKATTSNMIYVA